MAYLYRHIRLDKNEPFYIGIGSSDDGKYSRAYSTRRSRHWKSITNKTEYLVEIIQDNLTWEDACKKEIEFIKLYGRKDLKEGSLINKTDGGDGTKNLSQECVNSIKRSLIQYYSKNKRIVSEDTKRKMSISQKGRKRTQSQIDKHRKAILNRKASEETKKRMSEAKSGKVTPQSVKDKIRDSQPHKKAVNQIDKYTGEILNTYGSISEASRITGSDSTKISACCNNRRNTCNGYKWKFQN